MVGADHGDLEPILDGEDDVRPAGQSPPRLRPAFVILVLAVVGLVAGGGVYYQRQLAEADERAAAAERRAIRAEKDRQEADARIRAAAVLERARDAARVRAQAEEVRAATAGRFVMRDPILTLPASVPLCRARDLEVFSHGGGHVYGVTVANRSARPCGLLDHPVLQGLDAGGRWQTIPAHDSMASSYTDGPPWNGVLPPGRSVGMAIDQPPALTSGLCLSGEAVSEEFSAVRLILAPQAEPLVIPEGTFSAGACRPELLLWSYDHHGL